MQISAFRNPHLASLATIALALRATMEEEAPEPPKNDEEFVKAYAAKMETQEKAAAEGKPAKKEAPAPAATKKDDEDLDDDELEEEKDRGADVDGDDDDDAAGDEADDKKGDDDAGDGDDAGDEDDKAKGDEEDDDKGDDDSDTEFDRAAKSAKLPTRLDDLPEEARPIVEKRLKDMQAGFTRLSQQATEFRQAEREFRTEERYREAHPAEYLASLLAEHPELEDEVAAQLDKLREGDPTTREAQAALEKEHRTKAAEEIAKVEKTEREQSARLTARGDEVEGMARAACRKSGISFDRGVEAAIAYEIVAQGDIENNRIKEIVEEMAVERGRSQRAVKREERKRVIQGKTEARKAASPLRPGTGRAGGSTRTDAKPKTLEENMTAFAEKAFPGEP